MDLVGNLMDGESVLKAGGQNTFDGLDQLISGRIRALFCGGQTAVSDTIALFNDLP